MAIRAARDRGILISRPKTEILCIGAVCSSLAAILKFFNRVAADPLPAGMPEGSCRRTLYRGPWQEITTLPTEKINKMRNASLQS
jgi:hypothetical protein